MKWSAVRDYVQVLRALLRGEETEWEGGVLRMLHPEGYGAPRPIEVPILIGAAGPKGVATAQELGDGIVASPSPIPGFKWSIALTFGTVLKAGENPDSPRVIAAAGHAAPPLFISRWKTKCFIWSKMAKSGPRFTRRYPYGCDTCYSTTSIWWQSTIEIGPS
jgi:5,10-methylenetetrahydromethanopterin reductase